MNSDELMYTLYLYKDGQINGWGIFATESECMEAFKSYCVSSKRSGKIEYPDGEEVGLCFVAAEE